MDKAIFLMGPTASGKTSLAVELVKRFPLEIINVDSAQIYREMNIGSGKLDSQALLDAPHRLINIRDPAESYSAAEFVEDALQAMQAITSIGKVPLLVGGTMLYFKTLLHGMNQLPSADESVRAEIQQMAEKSGWPAVHVELMQVDPESAERLHPNDQQRLQRALEVYRITGTPMSQLWREQNKGTEGGESGHCFPYEALQLAMMPVERRELHQSIQVRFDQMLDQGLEEEVKCLYERGDLNLSLPSMRAVGYRQMWEYLAGDCTFEQMRAKALAATRQLAKRQLTWLRSWDDAVCLDGERSAIVEKAFSLVDKFLNSENNC